MLDILLSMPGFYFYLVLVVVLLITAFWTRESCPPAGEPGAPARTAGRGGGDTPVAARCHLDRAGVRSSALQPRRDRRPFWDLQTALSASYAGKLEQAIRTIRVGPPAGKRPTDPAAG
jgi:hypothetical protein